MGRLADLIFLVSNGAACSRMFNFSLHHCDAKHGINFLAADALSLYWVGSGSVFCWDRFVGIIPGRLTVRRRCRVNKTSRKEIFAIKIFLFIYHVCLVLTYPISKSWNFFLSKCHYKSQKD